MDREISVHYLLKDELVYEVSIRSGTPATTVTKLRKQLKDLLEECPSETVLDTEFENESELNIISEKINELIGGCGKLDKSSSASYCFRRSHSLCWHLFHRLSRIDSKDPKVISKKVELSEKIDQSFRKLESLYTGLHSSDEAKKTVECSGDKNVSRWNLRFNGTTDPRSFLERVGELQLAYGVSDQRLFNSAAQLFCDQGLLWFRGIQTQVSTWCELKDLLLEEFDPVDYDYRLIGEIRSRTQGVDEPTHIYFSVMTCLFNRLKSPLPEDKRLEILLHNIRPCFSQQLALLEITSISDLKSKCRKLEAARQRSDLFVEPTKCGNLSSEFSYKGKPKIVNVVSKPVSNPVKFSRNSTQQTNASPKFNLNRKPVCYKCGNSDHNFKFCKVVPNKRNIKCFKCGKLGFTKLSCPDCNNSSSSKN